MAYSYRTATKKIPPKFRGTFSGGYVKTTGGGTSTGGEYMKALNKKGIMNALVTLVLAIVVVAILGGLAGKLVSDIGTGATENSTLANATNYGGTAINTVLSYLGIIAIVGIVGVIIFLLLKSFAPMMGVGKGGM